MPLACMHVLIQLGLNFKLSFPPHSKQQGWAFHFSTCSLQVEEYTVWLCFSRCDSKSSKTKNKLKFSPSWTEFKIVLSPQGGVEKSDVANNILGSGVGTSSETCGGMLGWIGFQKPVVHIWENVKELIFERNYENIEWLLQQLLKRGYVCASDVFLTVGHCIPTTRERAY